MRVPRQSRTHRLLAGFLAITVGFTTNVVLTGSAGILSGCGRIGYAYDAAGRLAGVSNQDGSTASYTYDATGNTTGVQNTGTQSVWVQSIVPARGPVGIPVTITGGCFSSTPGDHVVRFGSVEATVTQASPQRLVAVVPPGAETGAVSVTKGGITGTSSAAYTVTTGNAAGPAISSVSPTVVLPGDIVTVTGSGFETDPLKDSVRLNQTWATVQSAATGSMTVKVPVAAETGRIRVRTAVGSAQSTGDVFIVPSPYVIADVAQTNRVAIGAAQAVSLPTAGKIAILAFDLGEGQNATVSLTANTFATCGVNVYLRNPRGITVRTTNCFSATGFVDKFGGMAGTWTVLVAGQGTNTGSLTATVNNLPPDPTVEAAVNGPAVTVTTTVPGQNSSVTFPGSAGQRVFFKFTSNTFGCCLSVVVRKPDGSTLVSTSISTTGDIDTTVLPVDGTYTIAFNPSGAAVGSVTTQLYQVPADATATAAIDGAAVTVTTTVPGQNSVVSFSGTAGQRVFFRFTTNTYGCCLSTVVRNPDGTTLVSTSISTTGDIDTTVLPATGTYTITFNPGGAIVGAVTTQLYQVPADATATAAIDGAAVTVTTTVPGQNSVVSFSGTAGQRVFFRFTTNTYGCCLSTVVRNPDGTTLVSTSISTTGDIDTTVLPATGTYTITFNPGGAIVGAVTTQLYQVPADATATATVDGAAVTVTTTVPGQNSVVSFAGTTGQRLFFRFTNNTYGCCLSVVVRKPDGTTVVSTSISTTGEIDTTVLPADGTYTITFNPGGAIVGAATTQLYQVPADATANATINGPTVNVTTTVPGQGATVTFSGTAGHNATVAITAATFGSTTYTLKAPDGTTLSTQSTSSASATFSSIALPATGTYTLVINPGGPAIGSAVIQVFDVPPDATGTAVIGGSALSLTTTTPGQNLVVSFSGTTGQRVFFRFTNNTFGCCLSVVVRKPDGTTLVSTSISTTGEIDTTVLPADGTYTITFDPSGSAIGSVTTQLYQVPADATATATVDGAAVAVTTTVPGQNSVVSFAGTNGQRVFFRFTNNTYGCCLSVVVRKPDGTTLVSTSISTTGEIDTTVLPADGTYTITFNPGGAIVGAVTTQLYQVPADATVTAAVDGAAVAVTTTVPGQNSVVSFAGTTGQRVFFRFANNTYGCCLSVVVRKPDGTTLVSTSISTTGDIDTTVLPADGTYTITFNPGGAIVGAVTTQLYQVPADATVTAAVDGPAVAVTTTVPGQNSVVSFAGTTGQRVFFRFTNNTYGCCLSVVVRKPDATTLVSTSISTTGEIDTTVLPATGTYTITFNPGGAIVGAVTTQLYQVPADATATAVVDGAAVAVTTTVPGQNSVVSFAGTTGQRVFFRFTNNTYGCCLSVVVRKPDATTLVSTSISTTGEIDTTVLPADGTYTITFNPGGAIVGAVTTQLYQVPADATATGSPGGAAVTLTTTVPGQNSVLSFSGTSGQRVFFRFTNNTYGCCLSVVVRKPDATTLVSTSISTTGEIDTTALPATGTYTITFNPGGAVIGAVTTQLYDVPADPSTALTINGGAGGVTTTTPGQNAQFTFTGAAGQVVSIPFTGNTMSLTTVTVKRPDGSTLSSTSFSGATASLNNLTLNVAGGYTIAVNPNSINFGTLNAAITSTSLRQAPAATQPAREVDKAERGDDSETWVPDRFNLSGAGFKSGRSDDNIGAVEPLRAPERVTAVSGRVLAVNGRAISGVTLRIGDRSTRTYSDGRFLLTGIAAGHHAMVIDGTTARSDFGWFEAGIDVLIGQTNVLPYTIWLTRIDTRHAVSFPSPTTAETVITTPLIPGFEVRLPSGARVLDEHHQPVTSLSITAIPVDRPPFPLPAGVETPVYFTVQPGGSYVIPEGAQIIYPNSTHLAPGSTVDFWNYDPDGLGWFIYGRGRVTPDGRQIAPLDGVRVYAFTGAMLNVGGLNGPGDGPGDDGDDGGDPVDLGTGLFVESHTDLMLPDVIPVALTRTYRQRDAANRPFGIGTNFSYGIFLQSAHQYSEADLVSPDGGMVHMLRTSPGTGFTDAVFEPVDTTGPFMNSTMAWNGDGWDLVRPDGLVFVFGENQPLQAIRDRHGNTVTITRSSGGQSGTITQVTSPNGRWLAFSYGTGNRVSQVKDNSGRTVSYTYDAAGHLTQVTNPLGHTTQYTYDGSHRMTSIVDGRGITYLTNTYDADSRVATQNVAGAGTYQFAYTTDTAGEITATTVTGPEGRATTTTFDAQHRVANKTVAAGSGLARTLVTERDPVTQQPTRMLDPYGRATRVTYDAAGKPSSVTALADTPSAKTASTTMNGPFGQATSLTDPAGKTTTYAYNANGDVATVTNAAGRTSSATYNSAGQPLSVTDGSGLTTTFTYDGGDLVATTDSSGNVARYVVDAVGRRISVVDALGSAAVTEYDAANNITSTVDGIGNVTAVSYDQNGNVTSVTDARSHTTTFGYDNADRIISVTDPLGKTATRTYDQLGRVTSATDRRGKKTVSQYDVLGRTTFVGYGATAGPAYESSIALSYDTLDRLTTIVDSATGTTTLGYDSVDNITSVATPTGTVGHTYDDFGRLTGTTIPGQAAISYTYDDAGQLATMTQGGFTATWSRDSGGKVTSVNQPNLTTAYTYNGAGQIGGIVYSGPGGSSIGDLTYTYDAAGRVASAGGSLARITVPATRPASTYDNADRLIASGATTFTYDDEGNLVGDGTRTYAWNARNQLTGVTGPSLSATFGYDLSGRRTSSTINGAARTYLYDGANLVQEQAGGMALTNRLTVGTDQTLRQTDSIASVAPITDLLGSVIGLVDNAGTVTTSYTYDPYGKVSTSGAPSSNTQQYTGREYDAATGLQNNRLRYYSPDLGRFLSQDPAGFMGGSTNPYLYAMGDPVNFSDPNGDCPICAIAIAGIISGAIGVGMGYLGAKMSGRKYTLGDGIKDFLIWGAIGAATEGLGLALRGGAAAESVWGLGNSARGFAVEEQLGGNLVKNFPTIDKFVDGAATSIKSMDLGAPTYQNAARITSKLEGYIDKVAGFNGNITWGGDTVGAVTSRALELGIPPGATSAQMNAIQQAIQYGASRGVNVIVHIIP